MLTFITAMKHRPVCHFYFFPCAYEANTYKHKLKINYPTKRIELFCFHIFTRPAGAQHVL